MAEARVITPPGPPLARGGKVMPHAPALSRRKRWPRHASPPPHPPLARGERLWRTLRLFPGGNAGRGSRHRRPLRKGGKYVAFAAVVR